MDKELNIIREKVIDKTFSNNFRKLVNNYNNEIIFNNTEIISFIIRILIKYKKINCSYEELINITRNSDTTISIHNINIYQYSREYIMIEPNKHSTSCIYLHFQTDKPYVKFYKSKRIYFEHKNKIENYIKNNYPTINTSE